mgnify:CR=1 FL=1
MEAGTEGGPTPWSEDKVVARYDHQRVAHKYACVLSEEGAGDVEAAAPTGRRAEHARDGVALAELAHVEARHGRAEEHVADRLGRLGLADAGRAEEQEGCGRAGALAQSGARQSHGIGNGMNGLFLADYTLMQLFL